MPTIDQARLWYPTNDPVHGFDHVLRVYRLAEYLCLAEGGDLEIVRAAVLLHDVQVQDETDTNGQSRLSHQHASAEFARPVLQKEGWPEERIAVVQHCIRAHRFRDESEQPQTLEAKILFDADKLDAIGATGVARAIAYAARAGQPAFSMPSATFLRSGQLTKDEPHSAYHEYIFKLNKLKERLYTASALSIAEERHRFMADFFTRLSLESADTIDPADAT